MAHAYFAEQQPKLLECEKLRSEQKVIKMSGIKVRSEQAKPLSLPDRLATREHTKLCIERLIT